MFFNNVVLTIHTYITVTINLSRLSGRTFSETQRLLGVLSVWRGVMLLAINAVFVLLPLVLLADVDQTAIVAAHYIGAAACLLVMSILHSAFVRSMLRVLTSTK